MFYFKTFVISILILLTSFHLHAQGGNTLQGIVFDESYNPIPEALIEIGDYKTKTDVDGKFIIAQSFNHDKIIIKISHVAYETTVDTFEKNADQQLYLEIQLFSPRNELDGVSVIGKTDNQRAKEQAIKSVVIDTRAMATQAVSITDLMNRSTGIRIRQSGGLGSMPELSVNGFQGKAIKYFKDGIPIDYLGEGFNINGLPLEMLERVEVYKGVLPVKLGADALGGAVNLVSNTSKNKSVHAFYEYGSFQTHKTGLSAAVKSKNKKWQLGGDIFYNNSKNNYKATVNVINPTTRNTEATLLPMFHNAYSNLYGEAFVAAINRKWADELKLSVAGFDMYRALQHPALMTDAYGALYSKQNTIAPSLRYKKQLLKNKLQIDQFISYNVLNSQRVDTLMGNYDWYGHFTPKTTRGESRLASQSNIDEQQLTWRSNFNFQLNRSTKLDFNYVLSDVSRKGLDPYGAKLNDTGIDLLSEVSRYQKQVFGLGLFNSFYKDKLQNELIAKYYLYNTSGIQNTWNASTISSIERTKQQGNYWGIADAIKYQINRNSLIRASIEYAYRLPERDELFGNNVFIVPNFELKPEKSTNINLGYRAEQYNKWSVEANLFYRNTNDLILLIPIQSPNAQYKNQDKVKGFGFDLDLNYHLTKNYSINANATWQDLRLYGIQNAQDQWKNNARLRNTPYSFANVGFNANYNNVLSKKDVLKWYVNYNFLREFYLETIPKDLEPSGFLGLSGSANLNTLLIIPNQHVVNIGMAYKMSSGRISIGAECRNIFNQEVFDYYRVQRPGRNASIKLSYHL